MLLVGDVDLGREGVLLRGALEADAVRQLVVNVTILWIRGDLLPIDEDAEALLVKGRGASDGLEGDGDGVGDAVSERGQRAGCAHGGGGVSGEEPE